MDILMLHQLLFRHFLTCLTILLHRTSAQKVLFAAVWAVVLAHVVGLWHGRALERLGFPVALAAVLCHSLLVVRVEEGLQVLHEVELAFRIGEVLDPGLLLADSHEFSDVRLHEPVDVEVERLRALYHAFVGDDRGLPGRQANDARLVDVPRILGQGGLLRSGSRALLTVVADHVALFAASGPVRTTKRVMAVVDEFAAHVAIL